MRGLAVMIAVALLEAASASAECESTDACLRAIEASQRATRALAARFEQTKHLSLMSEPLVTRGRFAFKAPDEVLWQIDDPKITVRIDQHGVHLPDLPAADAEMASLGPFSEMMRELSGVFRGALGTVQQRFYVTAVGEPGGIRVHLVPRNPQWQRMFRAIDLTFATPDLVMQAIHIDESLGDNLDIVFSDVHRNDSVADAAMRAPGAGAAGHD